LRRWRRADGQNSLAASIHSASCRESSPKTRTQSASPSRNLILFPCCSEPGAAFTTSAAMMARMSFLKAKCRFSGSVNRGTALGLDTRQAVGKGRRRSIETAPQCCSPARHNHGKYRAKRHGNPFGRERGCYQRAIHADQKRGRSNSLRSSSSELTERPERQREVGRLRHTLDNRV
jgi:hypothetical protein